MEVKESILKFELENEVPVKDLKMYHDDYGFEFPIADGHLLKAFSCDGLSVLRDRQ